MKTVSSKGCIDCPYSAFLCTLSLELGSHHATSLTSILSFSVFHPFTYFLQWDPAGSNSETVGSDGRSGGDYTHLR